MWRGECDTAIAGGTNVLTNPDIFTGLDRGHFLAKSGNALFSALYRLDAPANVRVSSCKLKETVTPSTTKRLATAEVKPWELSF